MVKKIKKYAKFVVCMALIAGLVAPSYAALSASDGSAFVTKAEFDSALADFNARLTTFEAGINSKIDSQVTSYLDRNGIWNGSQQSFYEYASVYDWYPNMEWKLGNSVLTDAEGNQYIERVRSIWYDGDFMEDWELGTSTGGQTFVTGDWHVKMPDTLWIAKPNPGSYCKTIKIIDKCTKSGLMFLTYYGRDSARMQWNAGKTGTDGKKGSWLGYVATYNGINSFSNQSRYNTLKTYWEYPLSEVAKLGTGSGSLSGWGAVVTPAYIDAWSSFQLSESVKFHTGLNTDKTGVDAVEDLKAEQSVWNFSLQSNSPQLYPYPNWWEYGQYRIGLNGDAVQYTNLFFVQKNDPVYATIVFTVSGRTPQNAVRFLANLNTKHFAGTIFMLSSLVY